jgi:hypothetical protein
VDFPLSDRNIHIVQGLDPYKGLGNISCFQEQFSHTLLRCSGSENKNRGTKAAPLFFVNKN